ncbi:MAG: hypothetical protein ACKOXO_12400 [Cyanobium sp.]
MPPLPPLPPLQLLELTGPSPLARGPGWLLCTRIVPLPPEGLEALQRSVPALERQRQALQLPPPTSAADLLQQLAQALLQPVPLTLRDSGPLPGSDDGVFRLLTCLQHRLAGRSLKLCRDLLLSLEVLQLPSSAAQRPELRDVQQRLVALAVELRACCDHPLTQAQLHLAAERGIPSFSLLPIQRLYQLGSGRHGRWIASTSSDRDSAFGVHLCSRKDLSARLLRDLGLRTPRQRLLERECSPRQLEQAAAQLGYPCVVKPVDGEQGRGVTAAITTPAALVAAFARARAVTERAVLLESHVAGVDHRLVVIGGRLAYAVRREAPTLEGDGASTVAELLEAANRLRRSRHERDGLTGSLELDEDLLQRLADQGLTLTSVPPAGQRILLRANANVSTGALFEDVTAQVHPRLREQAERVAAALRLEVIGIDVLLEDISQDPDRAPATIIELNSMPQAAPNRAALLLANLFPPGTPHSIPALVVLAPLRSTAPILLRRLLLQAIRLAPEAVLACPQPWAITLAAVAEGLACPLRPYHHPREPLLDAGNAAVIYVLDPADVMRHGLPLAEPQQLIALLSPELTASPPWQRLFRELPCPVQLATPTQVSAPALTPPSA